MYGRTGGRTFFPSILLGRLSEVDLKRCQLGNTQQILCLIMMHGYERQNLAFLVLQDRSRADEAQHQPERHE